MTKQTWTLQPTNEGHELDYVETFKGNRKQAEQYAEAMRIRLQAAMQNALIRVNAKNFATGKEFVSE